MNLQGHRPAPSALMGPLPGAADMGENGKYSLPQAAGRWKGRRMFTTSSNGVRRLRANAPPFAKGERKPKKGFADGASPFSMINIKCSKITGRFSAGSPIVRCALSDSARFPAWITYPFPQKFSRGAGALARQARRQKAPLRRVLPHVRGGRIRGSPRLEVVNIFRPPLSSAAWGRGPIEADGGEQDGCGFTH